MDSKGIYGRLMIVFKVKKNLDLAELLDVKVSTVSNWKSGMSDPDLNRLYKKTEPKGINFNWLITGEGEMYNADRSQNDQALIEIGRYLREAMRIACPSCATGADEVQQILLTPATARPLGPVIEYEGEGQD